MLIVHAGNRIDVPGRATDRFPARQVAIVGESVRQLLATLRPTGVVSAAAAGADLIVLRLAQELAIPVHVLMPIDRDEFMRQSVLDNGQGWVAEFDQVLARAEVDPHSDVVTMELDADGEWFHEANVRLLDLATRLAHEAGDAPLLAFTIRPRPGDDRPSVTDQFADLAAQAGVLVLTLDPRPGTGTGTGGFIVNPPQPES